MKIYLVRHGQRDFGEGFDTLAKIGLKQVKLIGPYFKDKKIDYVYCSPQKRATDTLKYIKPYFNKKTPIEITELIRQQSAPEEVGKEVVKKLKIGNETNEQLRKRVKEFLSLLRKKHQKDNVLISTHKMFTSTCIVELLKLNKKELKGIGKVIPSASITYFKLDKNFKVKDFDIGTVNHLFKRK